MSHTPGPWQACWEDHAPYISPNICRKINMSNPDFKANAHLLAAAPDLLEVTESLLELLCALIRDEVWEVDSEYPEDYERLNAARAAIAKAKGRKS